MKISLVEQIACVRREIAMRERVYTRQISAGRLKAESAAHEIAAMQAVLRTLVLTDELIETILQGTEQ